MMHNDFIDLVNERGDAAVELHGVLMDIYVLLRTSPICDSSVPCSFNSVLTYAPILHEKLVNAVLRDLTGTTSAEYQRRVDVLYDRVLSVTKNILAEFGTDITFKNTETLYKRISVMQQALSVVCEQIREACLVIEFPDTADV